MCRPGASPRLLWGAPAPAGPEWGVQPEQSLRFAGPGGPASAAGVCKSESGPPCHLPVRSQEARRRSRRHGAHLCLRTALEKSVWATGWTGGRERERDERTRLRAQTEPLLLLHCSRLGAAPRPTLQLPWNRIPGAGEGVRSVAGAPVCSSQLGGAHSWPGCYTTSDAAAHGNA